jgi:hypothetical protein
MKRRNKFFIVVWAILLLPAGFIRAEKVAELPELMRPNQVSIGYDRIFVSEATTIYVYSLKDFKLAKKFGKRGEGPQEFMITPMGPPMVVYPLNNKLYISSNAKLSEFTIDGQFITEAKLPPFQVFKPFYKGAYLFTGTSVDDKQQPHLSVNLGNEKFEKVKTLYISDMKMGPAFQMNFPLNPIEFETQGNRAFIPVGNEKFVIDVFDETGKKLYSIKKKHTPTKVPEEYKKTTLNWFKTSPSTKNFWEFFKNRISFRSHYPAIQTIIVQDGRIYVITYKKQKENTQCIILDLKGNELKQTYVFVPPIIGMDFYAKYSIYKGTYYLIKENEDEETWELFKTKLIK